jgi:hypothetical protein
MSLFGILMKPVASHGTEAVGNVRPRGLWFGMAATIDILEKPIKRIRQTCELAGAVDKFARASRAENASRRRLRQARPAKHAWPTTAFAFSSGHCPPLSRRLVRLPNKA